MCHCVNMSMSNKDDTNIDESEKVTYIMIATVNIYSILWNSLKGKECERKFPCLNEIEYRIAKTKEIGHTHSMLQ